MTLLNFSSERTLTFLESLSVFLLRTVPNLLSVECLRAMPLVCTSVFPSLLFDNKDSFLMTLYRAAERSLETHWMLRGSNISGGMVRGRKRERSIPLLPPPPSIQLSIPFTLTLCTLSTRRPTFPLHTNPSLSPISRLFRPPHFHYFHSFLFYRSLSMACSNTNG